MHEGVRPREREDDPPDDLVNVDVVVEREEGRGAGVAEAGGGVAENKGEYQDGVEEQAAAFGNVTNVHITRWRRKVFGFVHLEGVKESKNQKT